MARSTNVFVFLTQKKKKNKQTAKHERLYSSENTAVSSKNKQNKNIQKLLNGFGLQEFFRKED